MLRGLIRTTALGGLGSLFVLAQPGGASPSTPDRPFPSPPPTFSRPADAVIVEGRRLSPLLGSPPEHYQLFCRNQDGWVPVPFQIDERDEEGELVLTEGKEPGTDEETVFDANDELAFMAADLGVEPRRGELHQAFKDLPLVRIATRDPRNGAEAVGFLVRVGPQAASKRSAADYVRYVVSQDFVETPYYRMGYSGDRDQVYYTHISIPKDMGGSGENLVDRFKFRVKVESWLADLEMNEDDVRSIVVAYKDGPVRLIRRVENSVHLFWGIHAFTLSVDTIYYLNSHAVPSRVNVPIRPGAFASSVTLHSGTDYAPAAYGMTYVNDLNPQGVKLDGRMDESEKSLNTASYQWAYMTGPQGTILNCVTLSPDVARQPRGLYYLDDATVLEPPELFPGMSMTGVAANLLEVPSGRHAFDIHFYFPPHFEGIPDLPDWLAVLDYPLEVEISAPQSFQAPKASAVRP